MFIIVTCDHSSLMLLLQKDYALLKAQTMVNIFFKAIQYSLVKGHDFF